MFNVSTIINLIWCNINKYKSKRELVKMREITNDEDMLECIDAILFLKDYEKKPYIIKYEVSISSTGYYNIIELRYYNINNDLKVIPIILNVFESKKMAIMECEKLKSIYIFFNGSNFNDPKLAEICFNTKIKYE